MKTQAAHLSGLKELLERRDFVSARTLLKKISPADLAAGWSRFVADERVAIFRLSARQKSMLIFEELDGAQQAALAGSLHRRDAAELLGDLDPAATSRMLRELPPPLARQLNALMKSGGQERVERHLRYPAESVGALMRGRFAALDGSWPAKAALERIRAGTRLRRIEQTHLDTLMVVDCDNHLRGVVGLKSLVVAPEDMLVRELMDPAPRTLTPALDQENAVKLFAKYKLKSAPVVDGEGTLLGVVVYRDIFAIAQAETEEDFAKMAGFTRPRRRSVLRSAALRLPWLAVTCLGGVLVSLVIRNSEHTLSRIIALASFSPLIAGMGGSAGSQTATVLVRGLATGKIGRADEGRTIAHEALIGLTLGVCCGIAAGALAGLAYHDRYGWNFGLVVGLALAFSMTAASGLAAVEPFVLRRLGADPSTATGPLITAATDLISNAFYFALAAWLLLNL